MRASSGLYVAKLDHVRALAALMVYCWHVIHWQAAYDYAPALPLLSIFEEGHAGVALFMTLSGYLFAKIADGKPMDLARFYWNRFLRLAPLLALVMLYWAWRGNLSLHTFVTGFILPVWPNGTWSIAVELHFYLLFPAILAAQSSHRIRPLLAILGAAFLLRFGTWMATGSAQGPAYWTIMGSIDLFTAGMLWHELQKLDTVRRNSGLILAASAAFIVGALHVFNLAGGFYGSASTPSLEAIWIIMPTLQGLAFGALIAGYEHWRHAPPPSVDRALAKVGEVSYSIYLLHFMIYPSLAKMIAGMGIDMRDFSVALVAALATFPLVVAVSILSYHLIERPFLDLRARYRLAEKAARQSSCTSAAAAGASPA